MTNDINSDSFGNTYFNYFDALSSGFIGYNFSTIWVNFLATSFGNTNYNTVSNISYFTPQNSDEVITSQTTNSLYRFQINLSNTYGGSIDINTNSSNSSRTSINTGYGGAFVNWSPNTNDEFFYAVANNRSLVLSAIKRNTATGTFDNSRWRFFYLGWLKNNAFAGATRFRGLSAIHFDYAFGFGVRPFQENQNTKIDYAVSGSVANYSITCTNGVSSPTTTDLVLRDNSSPNYAIGSCYNLLKTSASVVIGQIYDIANTVDGNTEQKRWLCVGNWGSEKLLMRVWTEGF